MKCIIGTKRGMTQLFDENGVAYPATVLFVSPATVTQVKTTQRDGYVAVQLAAGAQKEHRLSRAQKGHLGGAFAVVKEFRPRPYKKEAVKEVARGDTLTVSLFAPGDIVSVSAVSKGKGFQGVVKRHGFSGAPKSHGTKHNLRAPGSIGGGGRAGGRVIKGMRMAGRMGGERVTVKNLKVLAVDAPTNTLVVSGAVPGRRGTLVEVRGE